MTHHSPTPTYSASHLVVKPAYGRTLLTKKEVLLYFNDGKDFQILSPNTTGTYCSKTEVQRFLLILEVRYGKDLSKLLLLSIKDLN